MSFSAVGLRQRSHCDNPNGESPILPVRTERGAADWVARDARTPGSASRVAPARLGTATALRSPVRRADASPRHSIGTLLERSTCEPGLFANLASSASAAALSGYANVLTTFP